MKNNYSNKAKSGLRFALLSLLMLFCGSIYADEATVDFTALTATATDDGFTVSDADGNFTFTAMKNNGATTPTQNSNYKDLRIYAKGTLQVESTNAMTKMVFTISYAGKKRLADITASTGTVTIDEENYIVTWESETGVNDVTFTVGDKATHGTDGSSKAGQFDIDNVTITYTAGSTTPTSCTKPVLSPASGETFAESLTVTATTATDGAKVVYNTDGGTTFTDFPADGLTLTATTTIYAKAIDPAGALTESAVVEATYTKLSAINGLKALRAQIEDDNSSSSQDYLVKLTNAVVTFVSGNYSTIEEDGIGIYGFKLSGIEAGQTISGTVKVAAQTYQNYAELTSIDLTDATVTSGTAPEPTVVTVAQLQNDFATYGLRYVKIQNVSVTTACTADNRNGAIEQDGNTLTVRSNSSSITMDLTESGSGVDVVGICVLYSGNPQLMLFSTDDVTVTGIDSVVAPAAKAGAIYDLSGRRVKTAERGLYIVNGQKVYVK